MTECNGSVMRIVAFNQDMTIESSHLIDGKDTNRSKGLRSYRQYFTLCYICLELSISCALQTVEGNVSRNNISLKRSLCNFFRQRPCHYHLIFHVAGRE